MFHKDKLNHNIIGEKLVGTTLHGEAEGYIMAHNVNAHVCYKFHM